MKTLRKLSNRKLDELQQRIEDKYWRELDVSPKEPRHHIVRSARQMLVTISGERLRRIGL